MELHQLKETLKQQYPYRTELHAHCSPASPCGDLPPEEVVRIFHESGFSGLALTNHFFPNLSMHTAEEMSHIAGILHRQNGPVNEQALQDCIRTIQDENQSTKVVTDDDLLERQKRMKQRKGINA